MARVYLSLGSNIQRRKNICSALSHLHALLQDVVVSPVYRCPSVGFSGAEFYNLALGGDSELTPAVLDGKLKEIEALLGRQRGGPKFSDRSMDIDLLLYDDYQGEFDSLVLPRGEILKYPFVLGPLADIAPDYRHPIVGERLSELWRQMAARDNPLELVQGFD